MLNQWNSDAAAACRSELDLRVYSARLLGNEPDLVMHGGGNTSVKGALTDIFGNERRVLFVKGSGWDLKTIGIAGFPATDLDYLLRLGNLPALSDSEMMRHLRLALFDPGAPTPSVEAILHALIPLKYVDHSHADAVVALSNTPDGEKILQEIYGDEVLILPYIMPGFILAKQVAEASRMVNWQSLRGIVLLHHGIFTFADSARASYDAMIELVSKAENCLERRGAWARIAHAEVRAGNSETMALAGLRRAASRVYGAAVLLRWDNGATAAGFAALPRAGELVQRGPLTPDHSLHTKAFGAAFEADPLPGLETFVRNYQDYFSRHAGSHHRSLDPMPRFGVWLDRGMVYLAPDLGRLQVIADIGVHTLRAIQWGEALGGWTALPRRDLFEVEYWELEQAKLSNPGRRPELAGRIALVTGAASGIGRATVELLVQGGAVVAALDIAPTILTGFEHLPEVLPIQCNVTDNDAITRAVHRCVTWYGGLDLVISNAGNFPDSAAIRDMDDRAWNASLELNLTSHMKLLRAAEPFLRLGIEPAVVIIGSKNVPAPGPGAAAYSAAKAGLTQLARVAALELAADGIRVNVVHPNAVFDTGIWNDAVLAERARRYGLSVEDYRRSNVLKAEVSSRDVGKMAVFLAGPGSSRTTGAQIPVDGGNERVI